MKTKIIFLASLTLIISSCTDFLSYDESNTYSEEQVFTVRSRSVEMANNLYSYLRSDFGSIDKGNYSALLFH